VFGRALMGSLNRAVLNPTLLHDHNGKERNYSGTG
jgi:hypothetical protein